MQEYTGLVLAEPVPAPELVSRAEWAAANLGTLADLLDPVPQRLDDRLSFAGPLAGALRAGAAATLAAEAGLVMGYMSQRVLGQYELSLLAGDRPARLLFVAPNLREAVPEIGVDARLPALDRAHELTHVLQFQGVPWLREHMGGAHPRVPRDGGGADRPRRRRRAAVAAGPAPACRALPRGRPGGAHPDARAAT